VKKWVESVAIAEKWQRISSKKVFADTDKLRHYLVKAIECIDLTTLEGDDTSDKVRNLCLRALRPHPHKNIPSVAAVCVYPIFVPLCKSVIKKMDKGEGVRVASVSTYFPSGQVFEDLHYHEISRVIESGADEIDMVINRGWLLEGQYMRTANFISRIKEICNGKAALKVIIEVSDLGSLSWVRLASDIALDNGADFIKTSTGKGKYGATPHSFIVMCYAVLNYYIRSGRRCGVKAAGGISSWEHAIQYMQIVEDILGREWLTKETFRIGASRLLDNILTKIDELDR